MSEPVREMNQTWAQKNRARILGRGDVTLTSQYIDFTDLFWLAKLYPRGEFDIFGRENTMLIPVIVTHQFQNQYTLETDVHDSHATDPEILALKSCTFIDDTGLIGGFIPLVEGLTLDLVIYFCPPFALDAVYKARSGTQAREMNDKELIASTYSIINAGLITRASFGKSLNPFEGELSDEFVIHSRIIKAMDKETRDYLFSRI